MWFLQRNQRGKFGLVCSCSNCWLLVLCGLIIISFTVKQRTSFSELCLITSAKYTQWLAWMRYFGLSPLCSIEIFSDEFDIFTCDIFSFCSSGGAS